MYRQWNQFDMKQEFDDIMITNYDSNFIEN